MPKLVFTDDFQTDENWDVFEEQPTACHTAGLCEVIRSSDAGRRKIGLSVTANKALSTRSNHVIVGQKIRNAVHPPDPDGRFAYRMSARIDASDGQSGPEFSIQNTRPRGAANLTAVAGIQYLPYVKQWNIWTVKPSGVPGWVPTGWGLELEPTKWYWFHFQVNFKNNRYEWLHVLKYGNPAPDLFPLDYAIPEDDRGFAPDFVLTLESENLWTDCTRATSFRTSYDDVQLYMSDDAVASGEVYALMGPPQERP